MGRSKKKKSAKKSATIVDAAPAAISPAELAKNGKREVEDAVEKQVITKKQKTDALELAVLMQKTEETSQNNKKVESSTSPEEKSELEEEEVQFDQSIAKKASIEDSDVKIVEAVSPKTTLEQPAVKSEDMDSDVKIVEAVSPKTILEQPAVKSEDMDSDVKIVEAVSPKTTIEQPAVKSEDMDSDVKIVEAVLPKTIIELPTVKSKDTDSDLKIVEVVSPKTTLEQPVVTSEDTTKTPAMPQGESKSSTLFVGNLSFNVEKTDIENFFKDAGTVVAIRLASDFDGRFKGFGHVEFETPEAAQKGLALNGELLLNREVRLDLARERGSNTQHDSGDRISFQKGGRPKTVYIRGFDRSLGEDEAMNLLQEHFGACGEITRLCLPKDLETGSTKGYAYIDFKDEDSFNKALELNGSELEDANLTVEEAKPRGERGDRGHGNRDRGDRGRGVQGRGDRGRGGRGRGRFGGRGNSGRGRGRGRGVNKTSERSRS